MDKDITLTLLALRTQIIENYEPTGAFLDTMLVIENLHLCITQCKLKALSDAG